MVYVYFRCKPMVKDLLNIGFSSSKSNRKTLPIPFQKVNLNINKNHNVRRLFLAWLLGYYDGDGNSNSTQITSASKEFLQEIKSKLNINFDIKLKYKKGKKGYLEGIISTRSHWSLTLGAALFNKMIRNYQYSMKRKRKVFHVRDIESYNRLKKNVINRKNLQDLVDSRQMKILIKKFNVSNGTFYQLCRDWNIITPRMRRNNNNRRKRNS